jgi:hypothetical protein
MAFFHDMSLGIRNALGCLGVGLLFIALALAGPEAHKQEAEFSCPPDYEVEAIYPDMSLCSIAMGAYRERGCGCRRPESIAARWYLYLLIPATLGCSGLLLLKGTVGLRVALLNVGFWCAVLSMGVYSWFTSIEAFEGFILAFAHLIYIGLVASLSLVAGHFLLRRVRLSQRKA